MNTVEIVALKSIQTSKLNPRRSYDEVKMQELSNSIKEKGVINPILIRPVNGKFEVICGERRVKASRLANLKDIPAIVRDLTDEETLELQVIENLQRDDLNPIEEAQGFNALLEKCKYTQEKLAGKIGKSQGYIAARLALLDLTEDFQKDIMTGRLLPGHVKYIMVIADRPKILKAIRKEMGNHKEQLTVRAFESIVHTVLGRQAKTLTRSSWGGGPEFNTKDCKECQFNRKISTYYGAPENRCVNSDCYNKKQRLARKAKAERVKKKMEKGGVVDQNQLKDVERLDGYSCKFDIKTCKRCDKKKVAKIRDYNGKIKVEEVCTDKECFNRKNKEAIEAQEKQREIEEQKRIENIKAKAARTEMDRNFWAKLLGGKIFGDYFYGEDEAVIKAYGLDVSQLKTKKAAINYFTGNKRLDLEEIFRFITYWDE